MSSSIGVVAAAALTLLLLQMSQMPLMMISAAAFPCYPRPLLAVLVALVRDT